MNQTTLHFPPASRRTDPQTSRGAEAEINATGERAKQQKVVLQMLHRYPGRTSRELATVTGLDRYLVARRLPELEPELARRGEAKRCSVGGRAAITWWPA
ncbi:MAG: MarR family transcriptional regulator [Wenzhouxiangella sp.]